MKTILTRTIAELKKSYTNLSIVLILIGTIASFFTYARILKNDFQTVFHMLFFLADGASLMLILIATLFHLEESLKTTRLSRWSLATPFTKNANHTATNIKTLLVLISIVYVIIAVLTSHIYAAAIVFWFITSIMLIFS